MMTKHQKCPSKRHYAGENGGYHQFVRGRWLSPDKPDCLEIRKVFYTVRKRKKLRVGQFHAYLPNIKAITSERAYSLGYLTGRRRGGRRGRAGTRGRCGGARNRWRRTCGCRPLRRWRRNRDSRGGQDSGRPQDSACRGHRSGLEGDLHTDRCCTGNRTPNA